MATTIRDNAKGQALLTALGKAFAELERLGAKRKALIFDADGSHGESVVDVEELDLDHPKVRRVIGDSAFEALREEIEHRAMVEQIIEWSNIARKQGLLGLEPLVNQQDDPFLKKGLQMLVDGVEPESIRHMMEIDLNGQEHQDLAAAKVFEAMGIYAPTLGIIGAVFGLIAVMKNLADPSKLGHGIAAAFTATIYGIASANLLFLPIAAKLKSVISHNTRDREMVIEGLISIAQGENPRNIETNLSGFLH